jgi:hypothetical protein
LIPIGLVIKLPFLIVQANGLYIILLTLEHFKYLAIR